MQEPGACAEYWRSTREEKEMFELSELAAEKIKDFFKTRDASPMRIFIAGMG
jgi:hypothetical protein